MRKAQISTTTTLSVEPPTGGTEVVCICGVLFV